MLTVSLLCLTEHIGSISLNFGDSYEYISQLVRPILMGLQLIITFVILHFHF